MISHTLHSRLLVIITVALLAVGAVIFALSPSVGFLQSVPVNERVLALGDANHDGELSVAEMRKLLSAMITAVVRNTLTYDLNGSGKTDKADLKVLITSIRSFLSASCGNGVIEGGETCDDGNVVGSDGCSSVCAVEANAHCFGAPSTCRSDRDRIRELADTSHDGTVSEKEAIVMMLDAAESQTKPFETVKHFDINYDGKISQQDLEIIVFQLNSFFPN